MRVLSGGIYRYAGIRYAYGTPCDSLLLTVLVQFFHPAIPSSPARLVRRFPLLPSVRRAPDLFPIDPCLSVVPARAFVPRPRSPLSEPPRLSLDSCFLRAELSSLARFPREIANAARSRRDSVFMSVRKV